MTKQRQVRIGNLTMGNDLPLVLIAGPCVLESPSHAFEMADGLSEITRKLGLGLIFKSSRPPSPLQIRIFFCRAT